MKISEISIAIVRNSEHLFLICLRAEDVHEGGKWEFPGGKVEQGETPEMAMCRELSEEVGLTALNHQELDSVRFDYDDRKLNLHFYLVTQFVGEAQGREGQSVKWVSKEQLALYPFPDANKSIIAKL
jgi:8-oxo-dGTP diphosphatase